MVASRLEAEQARRWSGRDAELARYIKHAEQCSWNLCRHGSQSSPKTASRVLAVQFRTQDGLFSGDMQIRHTRLPVMDKGVLEDISVSRARSRGLAAGLAWHEIHDRLMDP